MSSGSALTSGKLHPFHFPLTHGHTNSSVCPLTFHLQKFIQMLSTTAMQSSTHVLHSTYAHREPWTLSI